MAKVLTTASVAASALAFGGGSSDASFLAVGTAPGSSNPSLLVYRTAAAYVDGLLPLVARFTSPAAFSRVSCSTPTEETVDSPAFPTGLIAGGLENGVVAVWDPRVVLDTSESDSSSIIEEYFCTKDKLPQIHSAAPNLLTGGDEDRATVVSRKEDGATVEGDGKWFSAFRVIDEYFSPDGSPQPPTQDSTNDSSASMVAMICRHTGPVLGLSFSPMTPHFLASGAAKGKILVWDLVKPSAERISEFQCTSDTAQILDLSWNGLIPNVIASASNVGVAIWDMNTKAHLIRALPSTGTCGVSWCPSDKNIMLVNAENCCKVWDVRNLEVPLQQFVGDTIVLISWSPFEDDVVIGCSKDKVIILDVKNGEVVNEERSLGICSHVSWSQDRAKHFALATNIKDPRSAKVLLCV